MPRDGAIIFRDLVGKLGVLRIECDKCGRRGQYGRLPPEAGAELKRPVRREVPGSIKGGLGFGIGQFPKRKTRKPFSRIERQVGPNSVIFDKFAEGIFKLDCKLFPVLRQFQEGHFQLWSVGRHCHSAQRAALLRHCLGSPDMGQLPTQASRQRQPIGKDSLTIY
jgi:hypothetical protein